ncbi:MAG: hypothetical protein DWP98_09680 [Bacteroidetes bacterium]|nr:MAG: hypothetical protein DWP98_09680 [Bacteroidota bacterium]MBL1144376.1 hypothetical protein [Bacteroidota bacterium]NOG57172.1 hypothetical protein [Bacteroidota bacterium]
MGFFKFFSNKNSDFLKDDEVEAAALLQNICKGYAIGNPNLIPDGIVKLSFGIYMMAFNRTDEDMVPLEVLNNSAFLEKRPKLKLYLAVLDKIKLFLTKVVNDEKILANHKNKALFRDLMLKILKSCVSDIEALKDKK